MQQAARCAGSRVSSNRRTGAPASDLQSKSVRNSPVALASSNTRSRTSRRFGRLEQEKGVEVQSPPSYLKETFTRARYALTFPSSSWRSSSATFGDSKVTQGPTCLGHRRASGLLPGFSARTYEFYDLVHALGHDKLLSPRCCLETTPNWSLHSPGCQPQRGVPGRRPGTSRPRLT